MPTIAVFSVAGGIVNKYPIRFAIFLMVFILLPLSAVNGFRSPPKPVTPVVLDGVQYSSPHFNLIDQKSVRGGVIEARKEATKELLWRIRIYKTFYFPLMEEDGSDVFIVSLCVFSDAKLLLVKDENGRVFSLDLVSKDINRIK
ncbi:MAG: hypothetical protein IPK50_18995 [Fibrobacterota bacterium]|nr:MAG: hypothetical protein IPK50_18995 [Fibrobacterota bacterium]